MLLIDDEGGGGGEDHRGDAGMGPADPRGDPYGGEADDSPRGHRVAFNDSVVYADSGSDVSENDSELVTAFEGSLVGSLVDGSNVGSHHADPRHADAGDAPRVSPRGPRTSPHDPTWLKEAAETLEATSPLSIGERPSSGLESPRMRV